jgi:hypothetical protein
LTVTEGDALSAAVPPEPLADVVALLDRFVVVAEPVLIRCASAC